MHKKSVLAHARTCACHERKGTIAEFDEEFDHVRSKLGGELGPCEHTNTHTQTHTLKSTYVSCLNAIHFSFLSHAGKETMYIKTDSDYKLVCLGC